MFDRHRLHDHPAHRNAFDVRTVNFEVVEEPDPVGRHVREGVGARDRLVVAE